MSEELQQNVPNVVQANPAQDQATAAVLQQVLTLLRSLVQTGQCGQLVPLLNQVPATPTPGTNQVRLNGPLVQAGLTQFTPPGNPRPPTALFAPPHYNIALPAAVPLGFEGNLHLEAAVKIFRARFKGHQPLYEFRGRARYHTWRQIISRKASFINPPAAQSLVREVRIKRGLCMSFQPHFILHK